MTSKKAAQPTLETILRPGQTVAGKYCVDHLIAAGGMAAVWAGINLRTGKRVALKVILRSFAATPGAEELFRREALAASRINHPNVVTVFDVVDHATRTCIVMEHLDGEDLGAYFQRQGLLGLEEAVALLLPAMRGVAAANAQGVVHRDLKPKNIFLCIGPDGRLITTKILDFGISVIVERASDSRSKTVQMTTHGTPAYMSPEHITGSPNIDQRADVYGFGVILFEALAGQAPFVGPAGTELLTRILEQPAPKLTRFRPDLSSQMDDIIERAIAKSPDDRFPTLNHFIAALEEHVLPRSPILRSLTPVVGVPLLESGSGPRGLADPVVRVVRREPSGEHDGGVTKAMYTLSRTVSPKSDEQPLPPAATEAKAVQLASGTQFIDPQPLTLEPQALALEVVRVVPHPSDWPAAPTLSLAKQIRRSPRRGDTVSIVQAGHRRQRVWRLLAVAAVVGVVSLTVAWMVIPSPPRASSAAQTDHPATPTRRTAVPPTPASSLLPASAQPLPTRAPAAELPREPPGQASEEVPPTLDVALPASSAPQEADSENGTRSLPASSRASARGNSRRTSGQGRSPRPTPTGPTEAIEPPPASAAGAPGTPPSPPPPSAEGAHRAGQLSTDDF